MRILGLIFALLGVIFLTTNADAQSTWEKIISPGPLSSAHAKLEKECDSCHKTFKKEAMNGMCLSCHKGIAGDIKQSLGFHGKSTARSQQCKTCHSEHHGRGHRIIAFNAATFNHSLTDYSLVGGHAKAKCVGCHKPGASYRTTSTTCASCHSKKDPHLGRLGRNCQGCHTVTGWKKTLPFNHAKTGFPLTGQHRNVTCMGCHAGQRWQGLPQQCIGCHARDDVHKGSRGTNCSTCHSPTDWKSASFNHNRDTSFPLIGQHAGTACAGCHGANNAIRRPQKTCVSCHAKDDKHKGSRGTACANCHTPRSWKDAKFDHNKETRFPLLGAHTRAACADCHGANNAIRKPQMTCISCHAKDDSHKGSRGTACANCHTPRSWKEAKFDHSKETRFPLLGAHTRAACADCHGVNNSIKNPPTTCYGCHQKDDSHKGKNGIECAKCHNNSDWKKTSFDHDKMTNFPLLGAHKTAVCEACHKQPTHVEVPSVECVSCHLEDDAHKTRLGNRCGECHNAVAWKNNVLFDHDLTRFPLSGKHAPLMCDKCHVDKSFQSKGITCQSCHIDEHHAGALGKAPTCAKCHTVSGWKSWSFDHDLETGFVLTGKHKGLICSACHTKGTEPKDTSSECGDCHQRDDIHDGEFGKNCGRCHITDNFADILI